MAELPIYPPDAAICRLLADGPLPTAAIAARLAMPVRTARHRLRHLRRAGVVVTDPSRLHGLAEPDQWDLAGLADQAAQDLAEPDDRAVAAPGSAALAGPIGPTERSGPDDERWPAIAALAAALIGLAAVVVIGRRPTTPLAPPNGFDGPDDLWRAVEW